MGCICFSKFCMLSNNDFIVDSAIFQTVLSFVCYRRMILSFFVDSAIFQTFLSLVGLRVMILLLIQQFFKLF